MYLWQAGPYGERHQALDLISNQIYLQAVEGVV